MENCAPGLTSWNFFSLHRKIIPSCLLYRVRQFASPSCRPRDCNKGKGRAKREGDFSVLGKNKKFIPACQSRDTFLFCVTIINFYKKNIFLRFTLKILAADTFKAMLPTHYKLDYEHDINLGLA